MKKIPAAAGFILILGFFALLGHNLFPVVYKIKEPFFAMPVQTNGKIDDTRDLPVRNDTYGMGEFGARRKNGRKHLALDLAAKMQSPVYASKSGWSRAAFIPDGYGNLVIIEHPGRFQTRYGHLYGHTIKRKNEWVRQGDIIGSVGKTGNADSKGLIPHLHFEIRDNGKPIDPAKELVRRKE